MPKAEFKRINEEREEAGLPLYANPRNSGAGSLRQIDPTVTAGRKLSAWFYQLVEDGERVATQTAALERLGALGFPVNPDHESGPRHRGRHRLHRAMARGAPRPAVRDRRRRRQGRPVRPAGAARDRQPGAALGDRLQVPARAGRGVHRGHRPVRRADGDADAGRAHDARSRSRARRSRGRPSTTSTRSGARTSGSATGSSSRRPATSSPRSSGRSSSGGPGRSASSRCPSAARSATRRSSRTRARSGSTARTSPARRASARSSAISRGAAGWTSRAPAGRSSCSSSSAGCSSVAATSSGSTVEDLESLDRYARKSAENLHASIQKARRSAVGAGHQRASGIPQVGEHDRHRPRALADGQRPARRPDWLRRAERVPRRRWRRDEPDRFLEVEGVGPTLASQPRPLVHRRDDARVLDDLADAGVEPEPPVDRRGRGRRPARGQDARRHRARSRASAGPRPRRRSAPPAARSRARSRRRPTTSSPARAPARSSRRPRSSASRSSTRRVSAGSSAGEA